MKPGFYVAAIAAFVAALGNNVGLAAFSLGLFMMSAVDYYFELLRQKDAS